MKWSRPYGKECSISIRCARLMKAIELLTGTPAGEEQEDGLYPEGTVHALVSAKLKEYNDILLSLGKDGDGKKNGDKSEE